MPSDLEYWLAAQARALKLSPQNLETVDPATVQARCALLLVALAARGLIEQMSGCYAATRASGN